MPESLPIGLQKLQINDHNIHHFSKFEGIEACISRERQDGFMIVDNNNAFYNLQFSRPFKAKVQPAKQVAQVAPVYN